jgi:Fe2+ transport system protein FeoA
MNRECCGCGNDGFVREETKTEAPVNTPAPALKEGVSLLTLQAGQMATVFQTCLDPSDAALLRAMGLRPSARIRVCRLGEPCIVEVLSGSESCGRPGGCACRIGLARPLAERVMVGLVA